MLEQYNKFFMDLAAATDSQFEIVMPISEQIKFISKKYPIEEITVTDNIYNENTGTAEPHEVTKTLICFKNVVCKYRPHLHLGDYWLDVKMVDNSPQYKFYTKVETEPGVIEIYAAVHPHLSGGVPCLGNFQGDLYEAITRFNYIQFLSTMRSYLQSYNGRSTYVKGSHFKKIPIYYQLHSAEQIREVFDGSDIDVFTVAQDPMRWNWPKDMQAYNKIIIQGQEARLIFQYFRKVDYPYLKGVSGYRYYLDEYQHSSANKIFGYVAIAMEVGQLTLWQALEFVRVFLISLEEQYNGNMDTDVMLKLRKLSRNIYDCARGNMTINSRYTVSLPTNERDLIAEMMNTLKPFTRRSEDDSQFFESLKWAGVHFSNFLVLLRKRSPEKAKASTYLSATLGSVDLSAIETKYNKVKKVAYSAALEQLEKDKRRFIREINRPEISNIVTDDGQGTLFSQNL